MTQYPMTIYGIREPQPGPRWRGLFEATWPAYRRWYFSEGRAARPTPPDAGRALARYMPELLPTWARLAEQTTYDLDAAAMLTHWNLPAFLPAGCSQVATRSPGPALLRNYDYAPELFECVSISTDYLQPVIGTGDCLWGLLDGMNGSGLAVSLTFGGDQAVGPGFGIPLVLRYLLETCGRVGEAERALQRLPIAMAYNLTMIDRTGAVRTVRVGPEQDPEGRPQPAATNHRWRRPGDPRHAARFRSVERLDRLDRLLDGGAEADGLADGLLRSPLHNTEYAAGFGTLYTADYRVDDATLTYRWPGTTWVRTFDSADDTVDVVLRED
ncbi:C45 family peptidase [Microlunatus ginsengisoli]|uniref:C45 family autoproteolytic acyltransferase/hydolase n=1 Tax=Microlunatus ginsengisoli TaxID=363863 RepID=A0ABP7AT98_9ACTN